MKYLYLLVIIIVLIVSCDRDDTPKYTQNTALLRFETKNAVWTKTKALGTDYTGDTGGNPIPDMVIYGYYTGVLEWINIYNSVSPSFMNGIEITNNNGVWSYSPLRYFFPTGYHSFFAFAPYQSIIANENNSFIINDNVGVAKLNYNLPANVSDYPDLLFGWKTDVTQATNESTPVNIQFMHITSRITFSACINTNFQVNYPNTSVQIKSITLSNIYSAAQASIKYNTTTENNVTGISGVSWTIPNDYTKRRDIYISIDDNTLNSLSLTTTMTSISATSLFLIPQQLANREQGGGIPTITIAVDVNNSGESEIKSQTFDLSALSASWQPGNAINYQITYSGSGETPIGLFVDPGTGDPDDLQPPLGN